MINTIGKNTHSLIFCVCIYNVTRVTLITGHLQMTDKSKENTVKHGIVRPQDMSLTDNSNQVFLPGVWERGSFLYAMYKVIICNII